MRGDAGRPSRVWRGVMKERKWTCPRRDSGCGETPCGLIRATRARQRRDNEVGGAVSQSLPPLSPTEDVPSSFTQCTGGGSERVSLVSSLLPLWGSRSQDETCFFLPFSVPPLSLFVFFSQLPPLSFSLFVWRPFPLPLVPLTFASTH